MPQLHGQCWQEPKAPQHSPPAHLVLLPELAQDIAVNGVLHKADVQAFDTEVEVPKPEHEAVGGMENGGLDRSRLPEPGSSVGGKRPRAVSSSTCSTYWEHQRRSTLSQQLGQPPALPRFLREDQAPLTQWA